MFWLISGLFWATSAVILHSQERYTASGIVSTLAIVCILMFYYKVLNEY
jgi:hypothetical protein